MSILSSVTSILGLMKIPGIGAPRDDYSKDADKDDYSKLSGGAPHSKQGDDHYSNGGWKDAKSDDCQPHKDYTHQPADDCGKGDTSRNPGEALAKLDFSHGDFSHGDFSAHGSDHSGDLQSALASMSSDDALEYAIGQMGPADHFADHFDVGHSDVSADTSHHNA